MSDIQGPPSIWYEPPTLKQHSFGCMGCDGLGCDDCHEFDPDNCGCTLCTEIKELKIIKGTWCRTCDSPAYMWQGICQNHP